MRVPDLEFVASSIAQRWVGEQLSTELEEAFRKLRLRRGEGALGAGLSITAPDGITNFSAVTVW